MESNPRYSEEDYKIRVLSMTGLLGRTIMDEEIAKNRELQRQIDENRGYRMELFRKGKIKAYNRELRRFGLPEFVEDKRYDSPSTLFKGFGALALSGAVYLFGRDILPIDSNNLELLVDVALPTAIGTFGLYRLCMWVVDKAHYQRVDEICRNLPRLKLSLK
ncbi:hypothetical protein HYX18_01645 [Candidatus Woesearchaeota archaeon]|nr:hypothetical protein [Candidatus Woesearchaeota archaeon]